MVQIPSVEVDLFVLYTIYNYNNCEGEHILTLHNTQIYCMAVTTLRQLPHTGIDYSFKLVFYLTMH